MRKILWERLMEELDLDGEPVPGQSVVEITGPNRVLVENHQGICQYNREKICVKVKYGTVAVCGHGLELARMTKEQLIICGRIEAVCLQRREG